MLRNMLLIAGTMGLLVSCSRTADIRTSAEDRKQIVLIAKSEGEFWSTVRMGAEAAAKEFNVKLTFDAPAQETDVAAQIALVNKHLAYGVDALVIAASDYERLANSVAKADGEGVPVVAIESEIHSSKVKSFVGIDNYEAGRQAARKMKDLTGDKGRFIILGYVKGARNGEQRVRGILDEWGQGGNMTLAKTAYCSSSSLGCGEIVGKLLREQKPVDGILALNGTLSAAAAQKIQEMGLSGQIKLVGFDNSPEELEWLQEGVVQGTVIQNPFSIGYLGVKTAVESAGGRQVERRIVTGTKVIDAESMFWPDNQKMLFPFVQ